MNDQGMHNEQETSRIVLNILNDIGVFHIVPLRRQIMVYNLEYREPELSEDEQKEKEFLKNKIEKLNDHLRYASHGAYGQTKKKIQERTLRLRQLESFGGYSKEEFLAKYDRLLTRIENETKGYAENVSVVETFARCGAPTWSINMDVLTK